VVGGENVFAPESRLVMSVFVMCFVVCVLHGFIFLAAEN
jgi:hypothetical protein